VASLHEANLRGADLRDAVLSGAIMCKEDLFDAELFRGCLVYPPLTHLSLKGDKENE
jgi:uncharacterized protein YjbI with pentapeptide repeats